MPYALPTAFKNLDQPEPGSALYPGTILFPIKKNLKSFVLTSNVREREGSEMIPRNLNSWKQEFSTYPEGKVRGGADFQ